jgi:hypothetical protein
MKLCRNFPRPLVDQLAACVEQFVSASDVGFGLRHRGNIQKDERLSQMVV